MVPWLKTTTLEESARRSGEFWVSMRKESDAGEFWADRIKAYQNEPQERLRLAMEQLPLPGAFAHAAIALRAMIRGLKKAGHDFEEQLAFLYWLAAISSFSIPYSKRLKQPGFNVMEIVPGDELRNLQFKYDDLGTEKLGLLGVTDRKMIEAAWGKPKRHSTLNSLHAGVWEKYEDDLARIQDEQLSRLIKGI